MIRTEDEKQVWKERMHGFIKTVSAMSQEQRETLAAKMPIVTPDGHALSIFNRCYLASQTERSLTVVAGYRQWQRAGRHVQTGEQAVGYIYVPLSRRDDGGEKGEDDGEGERKMHFRLVPVFDIAQTEEVMSI